jgi:hypothetical protein
MTKKEISQQVDSRLPPCGQKESVIFCDRIMGSASTMRSARHLVRQGRHGDPGEQVADVEETPALSQGL